MTGKEQRQQQHDTDVKIGSTKIILHGLKVAKLEFVVLEKS